MNLELTAKDLASVVFERFVRNLTEQMDKVRSMFDGTFDLKDNFATVAEDASKAAEDIATSARQMSADLGEINANGAVKNVADDMEKVKQTINMTLEEARALFDSKLAGNIPGITDIKASDLSGGQLSALINDYGELDGKVRVYLDNTETWYKELSDMMRMSRTDALAKVKALQSSGTLDGTAYEKTPVESMSNPELRRVLQSQTDSLVNVVPDVAKEKSAMDQIQATVFKTRTELEADFEAIKVGFDNLVPLSAEQFTSSRLASIVSAATKARIEIVQELEKPIPQSPSMMHYFDPMMTQMAGQQAYMTGDQMARFSVNNFVQSAGYNQALTNSTASFNTNLPKGVKMSTQQMQKLLDVTQQLGSVGYFSANQVADGVNVLARQGTTVQQTLQGGIQTAAAVAAANAQGASATADDLSNTANIISDVLHQMGGELKQEFGPNFQKQMSGVGDIITNSLHHARLTMKDFLGAMQAAGPQASALGLKFSDVASTISLFAQHGLRGYKAGVALRRMLIDMTPTTAKATDMMKSLGLVTQSGSNLFYTSAGKLKSFTDIQRILHDHLKSLTPQMQQYALKTMFGVYALAGITSLANTTPAAFQKLDSAMQKTGSTQDILAEKSKGMGFQIQHTKAHWQTLQKELGLDVAPTMLGLLGTANNLMSGIQNMSPGLRQVAAQTVLWGGALLSVGGHLASTAGNYGMFYMAIKDTKGWAAITHGIGSVGKAAVGLVQYMGASMIEGFKQLGIQVMSGASKLGSLVRSLGSTKVAHFAYNVALKAGRLAQIAFNAVMDGSVFRWVANTAATVANTVARVASTAATAVWSAVTTAATAVATAFGVALDVATGPIGLMVLAVAALGVGIYELVTHWKTVMRFLESTWTTIVSFGTRLWDSLAAFFKKWGLDVLMVMTGPVGILAISLVKHWKTIQTDAENVWNAVSKFFSTITAAIGQTFNKFITPLKTSWSQAWAQIKSTFESVWNGIKSFIVPVIQAIEAPIQGLISTVSSAISAIANLPKTVGNIGGAVVSGAENLLGIGHPAAASSHTTVHMTNTIHVHGAKDGKSAANEIGRHLRSQMSVVSVH